MATKKKIARKSKSTGIKDLEASNDKSSRVRGGATLSSSGLKTVGDPCTRTIIPCVKTTTFRSP